MIAEIGLDGLGGHLALFQGEGGLLELGHHLPFAEIAKVAAAAARAVGGVVLGGVLERGLAGFDVADQVGGLFLGGFLILGGHVLVGADQDVRGADRGGNLEDLLVLVVIFLRVLIGRGRLAGFVEDLLRGQREEQALLEVGHGLLVLGRVLQLLLAPRARKDLEVDQIVQQLGLSFRRSVGRALLRIETAHGLIEVGLRDRFAGDGGQHLFVGVLVGRKRRTGQKDRERRRGGKQLFHLRNSSLKSLPVREAHKMFVQRCLL